MSWASYNTNNQLAATNQAPGGVPYDESGDVLNDGLNRYLYDAEGRICAVASTPVASLTAMTGYIYDADGTRVAKGSITTWSCDPTISGFATTNDYIIGPSNEQMTEMGMGGVTNGTTTTGLTWQHTNVWAAGNLLATYDNDGLHFYLDDPLGTRRVQTDYEGVVERTCVSLPFGDGESCGTTPTEHLFTGKERDSESGNDYFGARYYASSMGRFLSPDWSSKEEPVPYAKLDNPQTLNLYNYMRNNPLGGTDPDGHCSSPSVGKGQVGVCVDYYISTKTVDPHGLGSLGLGDNRGPTGDDTESRYRVEIKLVVEDGQLVHSVQETDEPGISKTKIGPSLVGDEKTTTSTSVDDNGSMHIDLQTTAINGYQKAGVPGAPPGQIEGDVKLVVTPDGKVGTDAGGSRTAFPALEIYKYQSGQSPTQILNMPQSSDSKDLTRGKTQTIPQVQPQ